MSTRLSILLLATAALPDLGVQDAVQLDRSREVLELVNAERARHGCKALKSEARLTAAAQVHSNNMAMQGFFSHDDPAGRQPYERVNRTGYRWAMTAENIAAGYPTANQVVHGWMKSPGHRANILNCELTEIGIGYAYTAPPDKYRHYWTQEFGRPRP